MNIPPIFRPHVADLRVSKYILAKTNRNININLQIDINDTRVSLSFNRRTSNNGLIARIVNISFGVACQANFLSLTVKKVTFRKGLSVQIVTSLFTRIANGGKAWKGGRGEE